MDVHIHMGIYFIIERRYYADTLCLRYELLCISSTGVCDITFEKAGRVITGCMLAQCARTVMVVAPVSVQFGRVMWCQ